MRGRCEAMEKARDLTGKTLAQRYELLSFLGNGAFGAVYEGRNELGKRFAIKVLLAPEVTGNPQLMSRFFREAKAAAAIHSAHIVDVYETGIDGALDVPFIVMELLNGEDLEKAMTRIGPFDASFAARVVTQAALGLEKAHAVGVVHRDVKPANIFLSTLDAGDVMVKVLDFGIAKATLEVAGSIESASLTRTGTVMGTPLYMSPEQAQGLKIVDERADVWSLGVCLFHMLAGQVPWGDASTLAALAVKICAQDAPRLTELAPWVSPELATIVQGTLARDIDKRTRSMRAFIEQLAPFCSGTTQIARTSMVGVQPSAAPPQPVSPIAATAVSAVGATASMGAPPATAHTLAAPLPMQKSGRTWIAAAIVGALLLGGGAAILASNGSGNKSTIEVTTKPAKQPEPQPTIVDSATATATMVVAMPAPTPSATIAATPTTPATIASTAKFSGKTKTAPSSSTKPATSTSAIKSAPASTDNPFEKDDGKWGK